MKKSIRFYNVFFPIWLLFLHPLLILLALPVNFAIDFLVVFLALKCMKIDTKKEILKSKVWRSWVFGFAADGIGALLLFLLAVILPEFLFPAMGVIASNLLVNPFRSAPALFIMLTVTALVGVLIYVFNRRLVYRDSTLSVPQQKRVCLALAIATAPYFYLLPTAWFI